MGVSLSGAHSGVGALRLEESRDAARILLGREDPSQAWRDATERVGLGADQGRDRETARDAWRSLIDRLQGVEPWAVMGGAALGLRIGVEVEMLAATAPLEVILPQASAPRVRVHLAAKGFAPGPEGWLYGPGGGVVVLRDRLVPAGFGSLPVLVFAEDAEEVSMSGLRIRIAVPGAAWAASLLRAGIELLTGSPWAPLHLTAAAVEGEGVDPVDRRQWGERLGRWGAGRLVQPVMQAEDWILGVSGPPPELSMPPAGGWRSRRELLREATRLQQGRCAALRFAVVQTLSRVDSGWD